MRLWLGQIIILMSGLIKLLVFQLAVILSSSAACTVTQTGSTNCVPGCAICNNGACSSCCPQYSLNALSKCQLCEKSYRYCKLCSNTACLKCISGYALNVTAGSKSLFMKISNAWPAIYQCAGVATLALSAPLAQVDIT